jgi:hypothetical protein
MTPIQHQSADVFAAIEADAIKPESRPILGLDATEWPVCGGSLSRTAAIHGHLLTAHCDLGHWDWRELAGSTVSVRVGVFRIALLPGYDEPDYLAEKLRRIEAAIVKLQKENQCP